MHCRGISDFTELGSTLPQDEFDHPTEGVWISKQAHRFSSAYIGAPCIILPGAEIRHNAYIRGSALVGESAVVGNATELKNVILFNEVQVPHYNYVGIPSWGPVHTWAPVPSLQMSNPDQSPVCINGCIPAIETGLKNRSHAGRLCGNRMQFGFESGNDRRTEQFDLPAFKRAGIGARNAIYKAGGNIVQRNSTRMVRAGMRVETNMSDEMNQTTGSKANHRSTISTGIRSALRS